MKLCSDALASHLQQEVTTVTACTKLTLQKWQPRIVMITNADPGVVFTRWDHGRQTGDVVRLVNVRGMTEVNRQEYLITRLDRRSFSIGVDTTGFGAYTHKGEARLVVGFTLFHKDIVFENVRYRSTMAYSTRSLKASSDISVDVVEHQGILRNAAKDELENRFVMHGITDEDLMAGRYDNALMELFLVNYNDLSMGKLALPLGGRLGETVLMRGIYEAEVSGKTAPLQEQLIEFYSPQCRADLGDDLDGSETWHHLRRGFGCKVRVDPPVWQPVTAYTVRPPGDAGLGDVIKATYYTGRQFRCAVAGISDAIEPAWNLALGATNIDGTVQWITEEGLTKRGVVTQIIDQRRIVDADRNEAPSDGAGGAATLFPITVVNTGAKRFTIAGNYAENFPANARFDVVGSPQNDARYTVNTATDNGGNTDIVVFEDIPDGTPGGSIVGRVDAVVGFFNHGKITFITGRNIGIAREIKSFSVTLSGEEITGPGLFEIFEKFPFEIQVGDQYEAQAGCDKSLVMCVGRFDNVHNRRAEDNLPGMDQILLYPDAK